MFERFTDRARRVVVLAQEEARALGHPHIGAEHILLGLVTEGSGVAAKALGTLEISGETIRQQVVEITGRGEGAASGHIPFTKEAKRTLELALREAIDMGHNYIGTEHILLGLLRDGDTVAARVLVAQGADPAKVRQQVVQLLHGYQSREAGGRGKHLADISRGVDTIMVRLARIETRLSMGLAESKERMLAPDPGDPGDPATLRAEITRLRRLLNEHGIDPGDPAEQRAAASPAGTEPSDRPEQRAEGEPGDPSGSAGGR